MKILKIRSLLILGLAESVSGVGNWVTMMAIFAMLLFHNDGSVMESSGIYLAGFGPVLLFSPLAGWLCDRFDRKRLMIASELLSGLMVTCLIFVQQIELIYILIMAQAICGSLMTPARRSVVPDLVQSEDLTRANAFLQQLSSFVKIGAPIFAGVLLSIMDPHLAIILDVISFGLSAIILSRLPSLPPHAQATDERATDTREVRATGTLLSTLRDAPLLRLLFVLTFAFTLIIMGFDILAPIFIRDALGANESFFGLLIGLIGLGSICTAVGLMVRKDSANPWRDVVVAMLLLGCIPVSLTVASYFGATVLASIVVAAGCFIGGLGQGLLLVQVSTLLQNLSPVDMLGRLGGLFQSVMVAGQLIAICAVPLLVPVIIPTGVYFAGCTLAVVILVAAVVLSLQDNRQHQLATR